VVHFGTEPAAHFFANKKKLVGFSKTKKMLLDALHRLLEILNHKAILGALSRLIPALEKIFVVA
jgi:hypothetical protein